MVECKNKLAKGIKEGLTESEDWQKEVKTVLGEEDMVDKEKGKRLEGRKGRKMSARESFLELAWFPGEETPRRSKPQSDKRSQPTNELIKEYKNKSRHWFFFFTSSVWFLAHRWSHHQSSTYFSMRRKCPSMFGSIWCTVSMEYLSHLLCNTKST